MNNCRRRSASGLQSTETPVRFKIWCVQFALLSQVQWPLTIYEVLISVVEKMERRDTAYIKKGLGVPRSLINIL